MVATATAPAHISYLGDSDKLQQDCKKLGRKVLECGAAMILLRPESGGNRGTDPDRGTVWES